MLVTDKRKEPWILVESRKKSTTNNKNNNNSTDKNNNNNNNNTTINDNKNNNSNNNKYNKSKNLNNNNTNTNINKYKQTNYKNPNERPYVIDLRNNKVDQFGYYEPQEDNSILLRHRTRRAFYWKEGLIARNIAKSSDYKFFELEDGEEQYKRQFSIIIKEETKEEEKKKNKKKPTFVPLPLAQLASKSINKMKYNIYQIKSMNNY